MTLKRFSVKLLIFLTATLLAFAVFGMGRGVARADVSKTQAQTLIENKYDDVLTKVEGYNGKVILDSIKDKGFADLDNKDDYGAVAEETVENMQVLADIVAEYESFIEFTNNINRYLYSDFYNSQIDQYILKAVSYSDNSVTGLDIRQLYIDGNMSADYVSGECASTKTAIENLPQKTIEGGLSQESRQAVIDDVVTPTYNLYYNSGMYSNAVKAEMSALKTDTINRINAAESESELNQIKEEFKNAFSGGNEERYITVLEETYILFDNYDSGKSETAPSVSSVRSALTRYENATDDFKNTAVYKSLTVPARQLCSYYAHQKLKELEYDRSHYSPKYISKMNKIIAEATADCEKYITPVQVDTRVNEAKGEEANVPTKVKTVYTKDGAKYDVQIEASANYAFSPDAYVTVSDYKFYAVKVNVNRILKKIKNDGDKKLGVKFYINIKIIDEDGKEMEIKDTSEESIVYTVKITNQKIVDKLADDALLRVVYYYSGKMDGYNKDEKTLEDLYHANIPENGDTLMFTTTHFSPFAICGTASLKDKLFGDGPIWKNPLFYIAIILLLIIVILLIMLIARTWKYKVKFDTRGAGKVKSVKAKKGEPFIMPKAPTCSGYLFCGWFTDKACTHRFIAYKISKRKNIKVYAKWLPVSTSAPTEITEERASVLDLYKAIRIALGDYQRTGFGIGFKATEDIARVIINKEEVFVYLNADASKYSDMGYTLYEPTADEVKDTPVKLIVKNEEDLYRALEIIDMVLADNGFYLKEGEPADIEISEEELKNGYVLSVTNEVVASSLKDYFELLRIESKSYVLVGDSGTPRDLDGKYIVKAKMFEDRIDLYLPYNNGTAEDVSSDALYKDVGAKYVVTDEESAKKALAVVRESMEIIGLKKYPRNSTLIKQGGDTDTAFGYKLKFN